MEQPIVSREELRAAIIHAFVSRLGDVGKIKIQKLAYFLQEAYGTRLEWSFYMHHYGPYSEDIETDISNLKSMGYVSVNPDPAGYGFHVMAVPQGEPGWATVIENAEEQISDVLEHFGSMDASQLELAATIHFVRNSFGFNKGAVISSVRARKPKFSKKLISDAYENLAGLGLL